MQYLCMRKISMVVEILQVKGNLTDIYRYF